jgi:DNA-binding NarL/FixJ family response regulator
MLRLFHWKGPSAKLEHLREPLNLIRNFVHILQEQQGYLEPAEVAEALDAIEDQVEVTLGALDDAAFGDEASESASAPSQNSPYGLSGRELEVLTHVSKGLADKQIASALGISVFTANKHVGSILLKMGASSRTEAGVRAVQERLI